MARGWYKPAQRSWDEGKEVGWLRTKEALLTAQPLRGVSKGRMGVANLEASYPNPKKSSLFAFLEISPVQRKLLLLIFSKIDKVQSTDISFQTSDIKKVKTPEIFAFYSKYQNFSFSISI